MQTDGPSWADTARAWEFSSGGYILAVFCFMPINLGLEAVRWRLCLASLGVQSWLRHGKAVLRGVALGIPLTHAVGDYASKLSLVADRVASGVPLLMAASLSQYISTLAVGAAGLYVYLHQGHQWPLVLPFWPYLVGWLAILSLGYVLLPRVYIIAQSLPIPGVATLPKDVQWPNFTKLFGVSAVRSLIILVQYGLLWFFFQPGPSLLLFLAGVAVALAIKTLMPFFSIGGMVGLRELLLVTILTPLGFAAMPLVALSLSIWIINVALPAVVGSLLVAPNLSNQSWKSASKSAL